MKTILLFLLFILLAARGTAQHTPPPERFEIGLYTVTGDNDFPVPNDRWPSWIADTGAAGSERDDVMPSNRWQQALELGATMVQITVMPQNVTDDSTNVALRLERAAAMRGLSLGLGDPWLIDLSRSERRVYQPESPWQFEERSGGTAVLASVFRDGRTRRDMDALQSHDSLNAMFFMPGRDRGAVVRGFRRGREPFRAIDGADPKAGFYVVSLRCSAEAEDLASGEDTVLSLTLSADGDTQSFPLLRSDLRAAAESHAPPWEIVLGRVLLTDGAENAPAVNRRDEVAPGHGWNAHTRGGSPVELSMQYHGAVNLLVDAVILSDEVGFALFNPGHPDAAPAHADIRSQLGRRIHLLGADSLAEYPVLRYLELREASPRQGTYPAGQLIARMLEDAAGSARVPVRPFIFGAALSTEYNEMIHRYGAELRGVVSGVYSYPIEANFKVRPGDPAYYDSLYFPHPWEKGGMHTWINARNHSDWYRMFALARRDSAAGWLAAVQNHGWLLRSGSPTSAMGDTGWLAEPTAAELRMLSNQVFCYGAEGLTYYMMNSWPALAPVPVVRDDQSPYYFDMGGIGFLDPHTHEPRRQDTNGENKWDSTRVLIRDHLKPMAELLHGMRWVDGYNAHRHFPAAGGGKGPRWTRAGLARLAVEGSPLEKIFTWPPGTVGQTDPVKRTFLEIGEYRDPAHPGRRYLVVVNDRVDPHGSRAVYLRMKEPWKDVRALFPVGMDAGYAAATGDCLFVLAPGCAALLELQR